MKHAIFKIWLCLTVLVSFAARAGDATGSTGFGGFVGGPEQDEDTLRFYLAKSDCVVLATFTEVMGFTTDPETLHYVCKISVTEVYKGDTHLNGVTTNVSIWRYEHGVGDQHPCLKEGGKCILFLRREANTNTVPRLRSADMWFGVQCPSTRMGDSIKRLSQNR